jgi:hypothetical protein
MRDAVEKQKRTTRNHEGDSGGRGRAWNHCNPMGNAEEKEYKVIIMYHKKKEKEKKEIGEKSKDSRTTPKGDDDDAMCEKHGQRKRAVLDQLMWDQHGPSRRLSHRQKMD